MLLNFLNNKNISSVRFLKNNCPIKPSKVPDNKIKPLQFASRSSTLQWGSSSSLISKKDFEDNLIKFLYPSKFFANKGILPLFPLY